MTKTKIHELQDWMATEAYKTSPLVVKEAVLEKLKRMERSDVVKEKKIKTEPRESDVDSFLKMARAIQDSRKKSRE